MSEDEKRELSRLLRNAAEYIGMAMDVGIDEGIFDEEEADGDADFMSELIRWSTKLEPAS